MHKHAEEGEIPSFCLQSERKTRNITGRGVDMKFALKGQIAWSEDSQTIRTSPDSYLIIEDGKVAGVEKELPEEDRDILIRDCGTCLIIPGMYDLHTHASQYAIRGIGMDIPLLPWLKTYTFPEETKFRSQSYADKEYSLFVDELRRSWTARACIFATLHTRATEQLMGLLDETGLVTCVGRVNMDRDGGENLQEKDAESALAETERWIQDVQKNHYRNTKAVLTPRFIPSCSDDLMKGITELAGKYDLRIQSHLSENPEEIELVKQLVPSSKGYADAYAKFGSLRDANHPSIMAHCVYTTDEEMEILRKHGTYIAHCPGSNMNLTSGIAPAAKFLRAGLNIGIGTDIGAGESLSMGHQLVLVLQASNLYTRLVDPSVKPLSFAEAFWLATAGGGSWFGKCGTFRKGYEADVLVIDDTAASYDDDHDERTIQQRLERAVYLSAETRLMSKYTAGKRIL
jgi:guanine deaminase